MSQDLLDLDQIPETTAPPREIDHETRPKIWGIDQIWFIGICLLAVSQLVFWLPVFSKSGENARNLNGNQAIYIINMVLGFAYTVVLWVNKRLRWWAFGSFRRDYGTTLVYLMLWLTSCYAFNREMSIFNISSEITTFWLAGGGFACLLFEFRDRFSARGRGLLFGVLAAFLVLSVYLSLFLAQMLPFSVVFCWFFGVPVHGLIPLILSFYLIIILRNEWLESRKMRPAIAFGFGIPFAAMLVFSILWGVRVHDLNKISKETSFSGKNSLPVWVAFAQKLPADWLTKIIFQADDYFQIVDKSNGRGGGDWFFPSFSNGNSLQRVHDPFVMTASIFAEAPKFDNLDKIKILKSIFGKQHDFQEFFWSGQDLSISDISTKINLDPAHRVAFTEKTFIIDINSGSEWSQGEAIFTFQLPENAAVSSLALWVDGEERPGILTAKSKADSAYRAVVQQERRDPAVVTWREGSQVSLRVFPVTRNLSRKVKIGVSSLLQIEGDELIYDDISFFGPPARNANESIEITSEGSKMTYIPSFFKENGAKSVIFSGKHKTDWSLKMPAETLDETPFSFDGKTVRARPMPDAPLENFAPSSIYLDINSAWSQADFEQIFALAQAQKIPVRAWLGDEHLREIRDAVEAKTIFKTLAEDHFSLFPIQKIPDQSTCILITKSESRTPNVSDLKDTKFAQTMADWGQPVRPIRTFCLGDFPKSNFLNTLFSLRAIDLKCGSIDLISTFLKNEKFPQYVENEQVTLFPRAQMRLESTNETLENSAKSNDHLLRIFAEQQILKSIGVQLFSKKYEPAPLVDLAKKANIVSPISSLLVLETEADYQRFGIEKPTNGLSNAQVKVSAKDEVKFVPLPEDGLSTASQKSSGSVPEPHEWALILVAAGLVLLFLRKLR
jgi:XrtN system VIT domain protein